MTDTHDEPNHWERHAEDAMRRARLAEDDLAAMAAKDGEIERLRAAIRYVRGQFISLGFDEGAPVEQHARTAVSVIADRDRLAAQCEANLTAYEQNVTLLTVERTGLVKRVQALTATNAKLVGALGWFTGDDTGVSSETILRRALHLPSGWSGHPHDASDRGRCVRMLISLPWALDALAELEAEGEDWRREGAMIRTALADAAKGKA